MKKRKERTAVTRFVICLLSIDNVLGHDAYATECLVGPIH